VAGKRHDTGVEAAPKGRDIVWSGRVQQQGSLSGGRDIPQRYGDRRGPAVQFRIGDERDRVVGAVAGQEREQGSLRM